MSRPPRLTGFDYKGPYRYLITCCTHSRRPLFLDTNLALATLAQFRATAIEDRFALLAYCLMPDHLHLLVEGLTDSSDLRRSIRISKQRVASRLSGAAGGRVWQDGYHDRVLRNDDDVLDFARYVLENPVRKGLVSQPAEYDYCGSDRWTIDEILAASGDRRTR